MVNRYRSTLQNTPNKTAGGVRIKSIISVDRANLQNTSVKEYVYNRADGSSSGILASEPFYFREIPIMQYLTGSGIPLRLFNSNMLLPVGESTAGSHIGYSEVFEIEKTLGVNNAPGTIVGSTQYFFTNFDEDIYGNNHMDGGVVFPENIYAASINNAMFIHNDRRYRRGKPVMIRSFRSDDTLVREVQIRYREFTVHPGTSIPAFYFNPACNLRGYKVDKGFGVTIRNILYRPISRTTIHYDNKPSGTRDTLITHVSYTYNAQRLISSETTTNSEGDTIKTEFFYPHDFLNFVNSNHAIHHMVNRNMINTPIEVRTSIRNENSFNIVSGAVRTYALFHNNTRILPNADFALELNTPIANPTGQSFFPSNPNYKQIRTYTSYDTRGNLQSYTDRSGVSRSLIWGYNHTKPIAYIENATWAQVSNALGNNLAILINSTNADQIRTFLSGLRNHSSMANAHVYSYTWQLPHGISSATDPSGITTFYEYDNFGRLTTTRDRNLHILERIMYNYRTP
jgi:YD repeat-containing protein